MNKVEEVACTRLPGHAPDAVVLEVLPQTADPILCAAATVDVAATFLRDAAVLQREYARQTTPRILATHDFGFASRRGTPAHTGDLSGAAMSVDALTSLLG
ncbi:hypothetical protein [Amycolatopsis tolypomycina]|uniref:hypothetical protein n=1 Tax=Amycolatopsis tolypomycina TaxID=208445 RepID=UPI0033BD7B29